VTSLTDRYRTAEDTIAKLTQQLADLMQAKTQHENQMIANFAQLLNEKKLKIRNQQRLLASATADPAKGKTNNTPHNQETRMIINDSPQRHSRRNPSSQRET
jgi:hypothetical protein